MPKALLFDPDGTLSNTDAVHFSDWMEALRPCGIEATRELYEEKLSGRTDEGGIREPVIGDFLDPAPDDLLGRD